MPAKGLPKLAEAAIAQLQTRGQTVLDNENASYAAMTESGTGDANATLTASDAKFIRNLLSSSGGGTVSDRISALTLLVQSSPLHNMRAMDTLRGMAAKKGREESGRATRALADWLAGGGGLGANKLK